MYASDRKPLGQILIWGSALVLVAGILTPRDSMTDVEIDPTIALNLVGMNTILTDNPFLTNFTSVLAMFGYGLFIYGMVRLWPISHSMSSRTRVLTQIGMMFTLALLVSRVIRRGVFHVVVHISEHGVGEGAGEQVVDILALGAQTAGLIARYVGSTLGMVGLALFAWGVSTLLDKGFFKVVTVAMGFYSIIGFAGLMLAEHVHRFDVTLLGAVYSSLRIVLIVWLGILGAVIYRDRINPSPAEPSQALRR